MLESKIDLHIHTYYSDGLSSPTKIVRQAYELGYKKIAITDHDGIGGITEAINEGNRVGLSVMPGIEIATVMPGDIGIHILGHGIDINNSDLLRTLDYLSEMRIKRNDELINELVKLGYKISKDELGGQVNNYIGKPVIARLLVEKGYAKDIDEVFNNEKFFENEKIKKIKKTRLDTIEAVRLIRKTGGNPVFAHPIQTKKIGNKETLEFYKNIDEITAELTKNGLLGIECFHPDQDELQTNKFVGIAKKYGLQVTRGSDFHGDDFSRAKKTI